MAIEKKQPPQPRHGGRIGKGKVKNQRRAADRHATGSAATEGGKR
jgi:hypothetical protein